MLSALAGFPVAQQSHSVPFTRKLQELSEELAVIDDVQERLSILVDRTRNQPPLPPADRVAANRIPGCVSTVWLVGEYRDGKCYFRSDAESPVVRGLVGFLCEFFSGFPPGAIIATTPDPLEALGLSRNLSPTRRNGLAAARAAIRAFAASQQSASHDRGT